MSGLNLNNLQSGATQIDIPKLEKDTYMSVLVGIVDLGDQLQTDWQTKEPKLDKFKNPLYAARGLFVFEIPSEKFVSPEFESEDADGNKIMKTIEVVRRVYKEVSFTTNEKGGLMVLLNDLDLLGKVQAANGDIDAILGTKCMVEIDFTSGGNVKVKSVKKVPSMMKSIAEATVAETEFYSFSMIKPDMNVWENVFRDGMRNRILEARNFIGSKLESLLDTVEGSGDEEVDEETAGMLE